MNIYGTKLEGVFEIENEKFEDRRGVFSKTFHAKTFKENGLEMNFKESFFSTSRKNVLRGMHFQLPPNEQVKLVYVTQGEVLDVVVDVRNKSETYGQYFFTTLSFENAKSLYIGKGFAHGFLVLSENATVVYMVSTEYSESLDSGIRWDSFGFDWFGAKSLIISERDKRFNSLKLRE